MTVTVRALAPADRATWGRLWHGYLAFYDTTRPPAHFDLHFARLTDPAAQAWHGLVAVGVAGPIGLAHVLLHPHGWQSRDTAYLQDLFVAPDARAMGAGRALMLAVYDLADRLDVQGVYWTTQHFNTVARALFAALRACLAHRLCDARLEHRFEQNGASLRRVTGIGPPQSAQRRPAFASSRASPAARSAMVVTSPRSIRCRHAQRRCGTVRRPPEPAVVLAAHGEGRRPRSAGRCVNR